MPHKRSGGDSQLYHRIHDIMNKMKAEGTLVTAFDVKEQLTINYPSYRRKPDRMLLKLVTKEIQKVQNAIVDIDELQKASDNIILPDPGGSPIHMSLLNKKMSDNYISRSAQSLSDKSEKYNNADSVDGTTSAISNTQRQQMETAQRKRKRERSKKVKEKGMYMGTAAQDIDSSIAKALSANSFLCKVPNTRFKDVAGISTILQQIRGLIGYPLLHSLVFKELGVKFSHGILLHGPPGCGKTLLANAIAGEIAELRPEMKFYKVSAPELVSGFMFFLPLTSVPDT